MLKLQCFGHLMRTADSLEKVLMLGKIEGGRRRGWWRMRWLDGFTNSMDCSTRGSSVLHYLPEFDQIHVTESVMLSNHLILCGPLLLLPSIFPSIRVFSNESVLCIRWPKYWTFGFNISPSNEYSGLISFRLTGLISLLSKGFSRVFSNTIVQKHQFLGAQFSL